MLDIDVLGDLFGVVRLDPENDVPAWVANAEIASITRTPHELSIVCNEDVLPAGLRCERGWRCLAVRGPLDFQAVGILESLAGPLARARIALLAISTYDTDYLLVRGESFASAVEALAKAGHRVHRPHGT